MKKLIILAMVVGFLFMASEAKAGFLIAVVVGGGAGGAGLVALGVAAVAPLIVFSPYFYQFYKHPECRTEPTIGDLSSCVQYGPAKK